MMALTGYWINGVCQASQAAAIDAVASIYPHSEAGFMYSASSFQFSGPNTLGVLIQSQNMKVAFSHSVWVYTSLSNCDPLLTVSPVIDAAGILAVFGWGFGAVVLFFFFGYVIAVATNAIKRA